MSMGILSALKLQEGSIQELAKLPQQQLVKMAQDGRINVNLLPVVLNEKAQIAQSAANMRAMAAQPKPSIMEQNMAVNAQADAEQQRQSGIANLPMNEGTFTAAGGGIVAFDDGGQVGSPFTRDVGNVFTGMRSQGADYTERRKLEDTLRNMYGTKGGTFGYFMGQSDAERAQAQDILKRLPTMSVDEMRMLISGTAPKPQAQAVNIPDDQEGGAIGIPAPTTAPATPAIPAAPTAGMDLGLGKERSDITEAYKGITDELKAARGEKPTVKGAIAETAEFDKAFGVDRDYYKKQADEIAKQKEGLKLDRQEAGNMRLIEAGLAIMGGESPYAFVNIGKGASKAMAGFAEDIKDIKKQSREFDKARREVEAAAQTAARTDSAKAQERYQHKMDKYQSVGVELAKTKAGLAERLADIGYKEKSLKVQEKAIKPSALREGYDLYARDEIAAGRKPTFEGYRKALGSGDETANLNRLRFADDALAKNTQYLALSNSKKPEDQAKAQKIREAVYARYGVIPGGDLGVPTDISDLLNKYK